MPLPHSLKEVKLNNGARGLLINVPGATVMNFEFGFRAGNHYVKNQTVQQTAHIMEHMAFGGTKRYQSQEAFSREFTRNAAYNNATTWETDMSYYSDCADMEWERILDLERQAITEPLFTEELLAREKRNVREELTGQLSNLRRLLWQQIGRSMGDDALIDKEKIATIANVTLDDIYEHRKRTHTLNNMRFLIAGNLEGREAEILSELEGWQLPAGQRLAPYELKLKRGELVHIHREDTPNLIYGLGFALNRRLTKEEEIAMEALNHLLTGTFHSRIFGQARTRGLAYGIGSFVEVGVDGTSEWSFAGQVTKENAAGLMALLVEQLQAVIDGALTDEEVAETLQFGLGSHQKAYQTVGALMNSYDGDYIANEEIKPIDEVPERMRNVTKETMMRVAREFLAGGLWCFGGLGDVTKSELRPLERIIADFVDGVK